MTVIQRRVAELIITWPLTLVVHFEPKPHTTTFTSVKKENGKCYLNIVVGQLPTADTLALAEKILEEIKQEMLWAATNPDPYKALEAVSEFARVFNNSPLLF